MLLLSLISGLALALSVRTSHAEPGAEGCARCHAGEAARWATSRHAIAFTNPTFRESFRHSGHPWCLSCHAATSRSEGVGCEACHRDTDGTLLAEAPSLLARLAHPIRGAPSLASESLCERCHQFPFPTAKALEASVLTGIPTAFSGTPSQDTVQEWRQSHAASEGRVCTSCHDPHRAPGAHDEDLVRDTLSVQAVYDPDTLMITATLTAKGAAHAVPTGDPFRRLHLTICDPERCDVPYAEATLQRRPREQGEDWIVPADTRIGPALDTDGTSSRTIALAVRDPLPPGARWRLFYRYADPFHEAALPREEVRLLIAQGHLVPPGDREPR